MIVQAKENLILRRETHLDQLSDKLKEERVRRVIGPILAGSQEAVKILSDDVDYAVDLGLVKKDREIRIANRIYQEVIPRELTYSTQLTIIELKLQYGSLETTIEKGIEQTWEYMDKCGTAEGYLLIINRSPKKPWKDKIFKREKAFKGVTIYVYGM